MSIMAAGAAAGGAAAGAGFRRGRHPLPPSNEDNCPETSLFWIGLIVFSAWAILYILFPMGGSHHQTAHLTKATISNFSISNPSGPIPSITGTWLLTLSINNSRGGSVSASPSLQSQVLYQDNKLAQATMALLSPGNWSSTDITIRLETSGVYIDPKVAVRMNADWLSLGTVKFDFCVSANGSTVDDSAMPVIRCEDTPFQFNQNGTDMGSSGEYIGSPWKCTS
ncbi:hypothetical protein MLD38_008214 [Melastoma candidum]|uniref:Uncharacterized protein n=1 Tax=Melastoma candidum TaxID=119954 RepID=A0ACB9RTJ4_9MYRT|nr:hypothetical protein MLD38_008214 [Melastoma candidum]